MKVTFRHGIVRYQHPSFLTVNGTTVDLFVSNTPLTVTIAFGEKDILHVEPTTVLSAWTGVVVGVDQWLYIDIDKHSGQRTFGITSPIPIIDHIEPLNPTQDQHWFDTGLNQMKVWDVASANWLTKVRIFVCKLEGGILPKSVSDNLVNFAGTQISNYTHIEAGQILFDSQTGFPIKDRYGRFVTSVDNLFTATTPISQVKLDTIIFPAVAATVIPKYTIVKFVDYGTILPADPYAPATNKIFGIIQEDVGNQEAVDVIVRGVIANSAWDWSAYPVNTLLYGDINGVLTTTPVFSDQVPIAAIVDPQTIILGVPQNVLNTISNPPMTTSIQGVARLTVPAASPADPVVVGDNDVRMTNARTPLAHTHPISDITNLQADLDAKLSLSGGTLTGFLTLHSNPTTAMHAVTKTYVDSLTLDSLANVVVPTPNNNDLLQFNGTNWINAPAPSGSVVLTGDITGSGSTGTPIATSLSLTGVSAGTYTKVTVDTKGRVTVGASLIASDIPNLDWSKITTGLPTTLSGYGITDAYTKTQVDNHTWNWSSITSTPTTIAGYGITDAVTNALGTPSIYQDIAANRPVGTTGQLFIDTTENKIQRFDGATWVDLSGGIVNSNVGTFGSATQVGSFTVNAKGQITAASNITITPAFSSITGKPTTLSGYGITDAVPLAGGVTITGNISLAQDVTLTIPTPTGGFASNQAINKAYADSLSVGLVWNDPINDPNLINDTLNTPPTPSAQEVYIIGPSPTGAWIGLAGHAVWWNGSSWVDLLNRAVQAGDRFGVMLEQAGTPAGGLTGKTNNIAEVLTATPGSITYNFTTPIQGRAVFVNNNLSYHFGHSYTYYGTAWIEFGGPSALIAGAGLFYTGNTLNVGGTAGRIISNADSIDLASGIATPGTYNNVTVDTYGRVTAGSNVSYLTANQTITLSGDASGSGTTAITVTLATVPIAKGGTGQTTANAAFNALAPSQATNSGKYLTTNGTDTSWATVNTGTVTSVDASGGTTGMSFTGGPVTTSGTLTLTGTLAIANGGTGQTTANAAINALLPSQATNSGKFLTTNGTDTSWATVTGSGTPGGANTNVQYNSSGTFAGSNNFVWDNTNGRVGVNKTVPVQALDVVGNIAATGTITGSNLSGTNTGDQTITLSGDASGSGTGSITVTLATVPIAKGGTGQTTANAAFNALAPSQATNSGKYLTTNGTDTSWATIAAGGTVTSINASGGTTGMSFTGGPVTTSGTLTLTGTLATANGGTNLTSIGTANQVLGVNNGATGLEYKTIAAGSNVTVTHGANTITIAATGGGGGGSNSGMLYTLGAAQNSTSGTSIDFTSLPANVERVTIMMDQVSTNGTSLTLVQLRTSNAPVTSGYISTTSQMSSGNIGSTNSTAGFILYDNAATIVFTGMVVLTRMSGNKWVCTSTLAHSDAARNVVEAGSVTLSGVLDGVRITTVNGTDAFDAGSINISYEVSSNSGAAGSGTTSFVLGTAQGSTSGTNIDFTSIPNTANEVVITFQSVSKNAANNLLVQLGYGATPTFDTTSYISNAKWIGATIASTTSTAGFIIFNDSASEKCTGTLTLSRISGNTWIASGEFMEETLANNIVHFSTGYHVVSGGTLSAVRITSVGGTDVFDNGTINITYSSPSGPGGLVSTNIKTSNYTASTNERVLCNTSGGAFTVTLPASPNEGDRIGISDINGTFLINNLTVARNGKNIGLMASDFICDVNLTYVVFIYNTTVGWIVEQTPTQPSTGSTTGMTTGKVLQISTLTGLL